VPGRSLDPAQWASPSPEASFVSSFHVTNPSDNYGLLDRPDSASNSWLVERDCKPGLSTVTANGDGRRVTRNPCGIRCVWTNSVKSSAVRVDTVVVWRVDRLGRSLIDVLNTVNLLRERGVHVRSISDGIDPATSTGRLVLNMLATLAEYEREERDPVRPASLRPGSDRRRSPRGLRPQSHHCDGFACTRNRCLGKLLLTGTPIKVAFLRRWGLEEDE